MKVLAITIVLLCLGIVYLACTDSSSVSPSLNQASTETILGLVANHTNTYQKFDSLITLDPVYQLTLDTSLITYSVFDVDQNQSKYDISVSGEKLARLIISGNGVALTSYYQNIDGHDSLFHFISPPQILPDRIVAEDTWDYYVAPIYRDGGPVITTYLNFGFGFNITRTYLGQEDVVVPAGAYRAHVIQTEYRVPESDLILKTDLEYLAAGIGLVSMYSHGNFGSTHIIMIATDAE